MGFMLGSECSPCCTQPCTRCQFRWVYDGLDSGEDQCDERLDPDPNLIVRLRGVRCGEFEQPHAPGKFDSELVDSTGYNGIEEPFVPASLTDFNRKGVGQYIILLPNNFNNIWVQANGVVLAKERSGWIEKPDFNSNDDQITGIRWDERVDASTQLLCSDFLGGLTLDVRLSYFLSYRVWNGGVFPGASASWTLSYDRFFRGSVSSLSSDLTGLSPNSDAVVINSSFSGFSINGTPFSYDSTTDTESVGGDFALEKPSPGPIYDDADSFSVSVYIAEEGCCDGDSCNPLP